MSFSGRNDIAVYLLLLFLILSACSDTPPIVEPETQPMIRQLLESLDGENVNVVVPGVPQWPNDLLAHQEMRTESFSLQAIVAVADGKPLSQSAVKAGVMAQIDRVALDRVAQSETKIESAWQYSGILRSSIFVDASSASEGASRVRASGKRREANDAGEPDLRHSDGMGLTVSDEQVLDNLAQTQRTESVQRMALELAGASENTLYVGNDRLSIELAGTDSKPCQRNYRWVAQASAVTRIVLDFSLENCPESQSIGSFSRWHQTAIVLTGFLLTDHRSPDVHLTPLQGVAWFSQAWGNLPSAGGAVAIDTLQLQLDNQQSLEVSRSKRRSGRGPRIVSAIVRTDGLPVKSIVMSWEDSGEQLVAAAGAEYPEAIRLISEDQSIDITVSAMNRVSESTDLSGRRLQVPVLVEGTQTGAGFLSYLGLSVSPE